MWIEPKTDWVEDDLYNAEDLNRVENNTSEVVIFLESIQYDIPDITVNTSRNNASIEFLSSINRVESNLETIKNAFVTPPGWLGTKTWIKTMGFDYQEANRLETNVKLLYELAQLTKDNFRYCGTFYAGEEEVI